MTTTSMSSHSFEKTASMFAPDMKGLHVIEFITNDQPYPAEKLIEKLQEFQTTYQEEYKGFSVGSSELHHRFSLPLFEQFNGIEPVSKNDLEAGDENDVDALIKKNAMIKSAIEKIRKVNEEQEKQLRDKEEELQELYETFAELEEELQVTTHEQPCAMTRFERARRLGCFFIIMLLPILLVILLDAYIQASNMPFIN